MVKKASGHLENRKLNRYILPARCKSRQVSMLANGRLGVGEITHTPGAFYFKEFYGQLCIH